MANGAPAQPNPIGSIRFVEKTGEIGGVHIVEADGFIILDGKYLNLIECVALRNKLTDWSNAKRQRDFKRAQGNTEV